MRSGILGILAILVFTAGIGFAGEENFVYDDHGRRDPFWKLVSPNGVILTHENDLTLADLSLEGILLEENGKNIAIINGRVVKESGRLGAFRIKKITANTVEIQKGSEIYALKLKKED